MYYKAQTNDFTKFISKMDIPALQLPNHKDEEWRFTNLDFLKDLNVNDYTNNPLRYFLQEIYFKIFKY